MEIKRNDATPNRPLGDRIIDAPELVIDLQKFVMQIKNEETWFKNDRNGITVFKSPDMRIVVGALHEGAELQPHKTEAAMSVQVLDGQLEVTTDEQTSTLGKDQVVVLHKGSNYRIVALQETAYLLTLSEVE